MPPKKSSAEEVGEITAKMLTDIHTRFSLSYLLETKNEDKNDEGKKGEGKGKEGYNTDKSTSSITPLEQIEQDINVEDNKDEGKKDEDKSTSSIPPLEQIEQDINVLEAFIKRIKQKKSDLKDASKPKVEKIDGSAFINVNLKYGEKTFTWLTDLGSKANISSLKKQTVHYTKLSNFSLMIDGVGKDLTEYDGKVILFNLGFQDGINVVIGNK